MNYTPWFPLAYAMGYGAHSREMPFSYFSILNPKTVSPELHQMLHDFGYQEYQNRFVGRNVYDLEDVSWFISAEDMRDDLLIPIVPARKIFERTRLIKGSSGPNVNLQGTVGVHGTGMGAASFCHSTAPVAGNPFGASSGSPTGTSTSTASTTTASTTANLFAVGGSTGTAALASTTTTTTTAAPVASHPFGACSGSPAGTTTASTFNFGTPRSATVQPPPNIFGSASTTVPKPTGLLSAALSPLPLPPPPPAAPTSNSAPGGPAFDSLVMALDESDAVRVAVEEAKNDPDEVARLRPTANVEVKVSGIIRNSAPPLFLACSRDGGDLKKAALLLLAGADINGRNDSCNWTPLHTASTNGKVYHVRLLLAWGGADLHAKSSGFDGGRTPLYYAIQKGHVEVVRLLRDAGAVE
jgi:hypothetical protein